jgi:hypothetical protein
MLKLLQLLPWPPPTSTIPTVYPVAECGLHKEVDEKFYCNNDNYHLLIMGPTYNIAKKIAVMTAQFKIKQNKKGK